MPTPELAGGRGYFGSSHFPTLCSLSMFLLPLTGHSSPLTGALIHLTGFVLAPSSQDCAPDRLWSLLAASLCAATTQQSSLGQGLV